MDQRQQDVITKYGALRRSVECDYTQAVACVIRQRKPGDPITDTFMDAVLFPFTHDPIKPLTPADQEACMAYLVWWAHHGVHPVRVIQELRKRNQRTLADETWRLVCTNSRAFRVAIPLMDEETHQAFSFSQGYCKLRTHLGLNQSRPYQHIAIAKLQDGSHGVVMYKKGDRKFKMYKPFGGEDEDDLSLHRLDDGDTIVSVNGNEILATHVSQGTVLHSLADTRRTQLDVPPGDSLVKCYRMQSDARDTLSLTRDGNLCRNIQVLHTDSDPCVDVVPVMISQRFVPCFFVLSADGGVRFVHFWPSAVSPLPAWRLLNDPVVQIAPRSRTFDQVVALHATGTVTVHDLFYSTHSVEIIPTGHERVTLLPKTIATHNMSLDDGRYVMSFLAVVNYSQLCCIRRVFSEAPQDGITREFLLHKHDAWDVIKLENDGHRLNDVIEMVQHGAACYLLAARGWVYECNVDYDDKSYTVESVERLRFS